MTETGEYPKGHILKHTQRAYQLTKIWGKEKVWCTIPDYCDDVNPGVCPNNVEKTLVNIERFLAEHPEVNWLPVLQAKMHDRKSFMRSIDGLKVITPYTSQIAIGTVCKSQNIKFIRWCARAARHHFPKAWIHAFGLTLKAIPSVRPYLNSWDSLAWGWMVGTKNRPYQGSDRSPYFWDYIKRIRELDPDFEEPNGRSETVVSTHKEEVRG